MLRTIKRRLNKLVTKVYDPLVDIKIGNQTIKIPMSHQLREIMDLYPEYNFNLPRIIKYITDSKKQAVNVIDIGANIGDTVAFIRNFSDVPVLCIDGEEKYVQILRKNVAQYKNISICQTLVGAENTEANVKLKVEKGTAYLEKAKQATTIRTLENILEEFPEFKNAGVLKSDTDGFDTIILRSCEQFLKTVHPVIFFEFDPYLIKRNNDDPVDFISYLKNCGYRYFMFYVNNGDFMLSCNGDELGTIDQVIDYFSGRKMDMFTDICAFHSEDKALFDISVKNELEHFKKVRNY
jgi:FkbM family methyltransferase